MDLLHHLENTTFPTNATLVTIDVVGLYLNIPHDEGIASTIRHLHEVAPQEDQPPFPPEATRALLDIVLKHNIFEFDGKMYHQGQGTAIGTRVAPSYANLFMSDFEQNFLKTYHTQPILWRRFIDDIFVVWPGPPDTVDQLLEDLNSAHNTIKFTAKTSTSKAVFLDLVVYKGPRFTSSNKLDTRPHFKDTNKFQYLHFSSCHPRSTFTGIARGELTRMLRASSDETTFNKSARFIISKLRARGYPAALLNNALSDLRFNDRADKLTPREPQQERPLPFILPYSDRVPRLSLKQVLNSGPPHIRPTMAFTKGKTTANHLVRARLSKTRRPPQSKTKITIRQLPTFSAASTPCRTPLCGCCPSMSKKLVVYSTDNAAWFQTPRGTNCTSFRLIYLIECKKCPPKTKYVGETTGTLAKRLAGHRAALGRGKNTPLYRHLRTTNHNWKDVTVSILELVQEEDDILERELHWMQQLKTTVPLGLNQKT